MREEGSIPVNIPNIPDQQEAHLWVYLLWFSSFGNSYDSSLRTSTRCATPEWE